MDLLVVVGLETEARIAAAPGVRTVRGGGRSAALAAALATTLDEAPARAVLSFGVAGALVAGLDIGAVIVPGAVVDATGEIFPTDPAWSTALRRACAASAGRLVGSDRIIAQVEAKRALGAASSADAVDMESHVAARAAQAHGLPFACLRVISDRVDHRLPPAAQAGLRSDGGVDVGAVLRALARSPSQLPSLIRTARDAGRAFRTLIRVRTSVGPHFGAAP